MTADPFTVLGLPPWPDLDDETVQAAWRLIAGETFPGRPDGGDPARYTQAFAAYTELRTPLGRSETYAGLHDQDRHDGPGDDEDEDGEDDPGGTWTLVGPLPPDAVVVVLRPVALRKVLAMVGAVPGRILRGHPVRLLVRAAATAGLCAAVLTVFPGSAITACVTVALIGVLVVYARQDLAPPGH